MKGKSNDKIKNTVPGPGTYEERLSQSPVFKMGTAPRSKEMGSELVGPGMYENNHKKIGTEGPKFSLGVKTQAKNNNESPGPGAYEPILELIR